MIKKSLALIMAAMIAMSFTACNGSSNEESSVESTNTSSSAESALHQKPNQRLHQIQNQAPHHLKQANLLSIQFQI